MRLWRCKSASFPLHEVSPRGKIAGTGSRGGKRSGEGIRDSSDRTQSSVSVCVRVSAWQRARQPVARRNAIKYLSANPSCHAIRVTIRNSRFAHGGVTACADTRPARRHIGHVPIYITRASPQSSIFRPARWTINRLFARALVYTQRGGNISQRCKQTIFRGNAQTLAVDWSLKSQ